MTDELIPLFQGTKYQVRVKDLDDDPWIPLIDLSQAWSLDRSTLFKHLERNPELFRDCTRIIDFLSKDGTEAVRCVNEEGLYLLIARISSGRLKDPAARSAIMHFRASAPRLIRAYRKKEIVQIPPTPDIKTELMQAKEYAEICQCDAHTLQAAVFKKYHEPELADALQPSLVHGEMGWYNPTRLITLCNDPDLTPERLNWYLYNKGYQVREGFIWRLTPQGKEHGMEYSYETPSGHREIRIRWRESILYASGLKKPIPDDQMALRARA